MTDEDLIARAREAGAKLRRRRGDLDRLAGQLLAQLADRLDARPAGHLAAAEVRAMLDANTVRYKGHLEAGSDESVLQPIRAERLQVIDRMIALAGAPVASVWARCKRCEAATASVPCTRCGEPACANCGRCPPCDGDLPGEKE